MQLTLCKPTDAMGDSIAFLKADGFESVTSAMYRLGTPPAQDARGRLHYRPWLRQLGNGSAVPRLSARTWKQMSSDFNYCVYGHYLSSCFCLKEPG
jgi:hypothetical protein